jgi:hypothetical protein
MVMEISNRDYIAKGLNISTRTIEGISYIYLERTKEMLRLNETGSFIWDFIDGTSTSQDIEDCVCSHYEVSDDIHKLISDFLAELSEEGIIVFSKSHFTGVMRSV